MSHFTVLVIGDDVDGQLAPYHEFECTGHNDQYVQTIDQLAEAREAYEGRTTTLVIAPDGSLHYPHDDEFYRDPTSEELKEIGPLAGTGGGRGLHWTSKDWGDGRGYRTKVHGLPDGYEEVELPMRDVMTFAKFIEYDYGRNVVKPGEEPDMEGKHKYGWYRVNEAGDVVECVDRTNPSAKWDWYVVGGRAHGFFRLKPGAAGHLNRPSLLAMRDPDYEPPPANAADQARKGDIDFEGMRDEYESERLRLYDKVHRLIAGRRVIPWSEFVAKIEAKELSADEARAHCGAQPVMQDIDGAQDEDLRWVRFRGIDEFLVPREEFRAKARRQAVQTFAVVKDGKWYERGEMGWFAMVSNEKDEDEWNKQFSELLDGLPDDTLLTIVDCHI